MTSNIVFEPHLAECISEAESRTHAFVGRNFGAVSREIRGGSDGW